MKRSKIFIRYQLFLSLFIACSFQNMAQQNAPDILWKSLKSEHFELIFPNGMENNAQRIANTLEWTYNNNTLSLNVKPKPVSLILYNRSATSNAFAALGPRMMGWYLTPSQSVVTVGSSDWLQLLSIHEYRHIVQYAKNRQHFTKFMTFLFGDIGQGMMRYSIPDWFFEGDAVAMETAFTQSGRGRVPEFSMPTRAYLLNNEKFTYDQAYLGSFNRYYSSHYHLGYHLVAYGRINYGKDLWDKVLDQTNRISWWPYAFNSSLKKYTGLSANKYYKSAMHEFDSIWKKQDSLIIPSEYTIVNTRKKKVRTNYYYPQYDSDGNIICSKTSLDKIPALYKIFPDGKEKKLKDSDADIFNIGNDIISWTRSIPDLRWGLQSYADVILYGLKSGKEKRITLKKYYYSPAISPDGKKIVVVEHPSDQKTSLLLLNPITGDVMKTFDSLNKENDFIRTPVWSADGKFVVFTHSKYNGIALSVLNTETSEVKKLIDYNWENLSRPVFYKNYIIYNSDYSGIGNIYAIDVNTGEQFQITSSRFGAYNASISPDLEKMAYQEYSKLGYDIAEIKLNPSDWKKIENIKNTDPQYYMPVVEQEGSRLINRQNFQENVYPVTKYKKVKDAFKIHSWGIYPFIPYLQAGFFSDNYLNTISVQGGYLYNINEQTHGGYLGFSYLKYFPVLNVTATYLQKDNSYLFYADSVNFFSDTIVNLYWNEFRLKAGITLPFNLSRNVYNTSLSFSFGAEYTYIDNKPYRYIDEIYQGDITPLYFSFAFSNYRDYSWRDFKPKFGQFLNFDYTKIMPYDADYEGYIFSARGNLYFPGLLANHSLKLGGVYEKQLDYDRYNYKRYYFSSKAAFARGYSSVVLDKFYKYSVDYEFPLWSPDLSIGPLAYIKRIRLGGFYDYLYGQLGDSDAVFESVGANIRFEFNVFRIRYPLEFGVQYSYRVYDGDYRISLLILGLPI